MFPFFNKKKAIASFPIDRPKVSIAADSHNIEALLKDAGIEYTIVTDGYVIFSGYVFDSDIPLMIGIHFNPHKVEFIEIFRQRNTTKPTNIISMFPLLSYPVC